MYTEPETSVNKFLVAVIILVLGLSVYGYMDRARVGSWLAKESIENDKAELTQKINKLEGEIAAMKEEMNKEAEPAAAEEKMQQVFGSGGEVSPEKAAPQESPAQAEQDVCRATREQLQAFFNYLDRQDYVMSYQIQEGTYPHFKGLLARLLKTPPTVERETDSLLRVLQNRAHFFRVLGKKDTLLVRDILLKEKDIMEPSFALLYRAMEEQDRCQADGSVLYLPLKEVYPYAVFFLNTLGGRSYLMRRDSRVRMLTQYYCIRILDQANHHELNRLGLDIRPPINSLMEDIKSSVNLTHKKEYLETLQTLRDKYRARYGE